MTTPTRGDILSQAYDRDHRPNRSSPVVAIVVGAVIASASIGVASAGWALLNKSIAERIELDVTR